MKLKMWTLFIGSIFSSFSFAISFDKNVPIKVQKQLLKDLEWLYSVKGSGATELHKDIFGPVDGQNYKNYIESKLNIIGYGDCLGVACANEIEDDKIYLTKKFSDLSLSTLVRIETILHEVKHLDRNYASWPHTGCPTPFIGENGKHVISNMTGKKLEGQEGCDWAPYGAYGSTAIWLKNIALFCDNCSAEMKAEAHYLAYDQMKRVTDKYSYSVMLEDYLPFEK